MQIGNTKEDRATTWSLKRCYGEQLRGHTESQEFPTKFVGMPIPTDFVDTGGACV